MQRILVLFLSCGILLFQSCSFTKKIKDGTMAYELKQYSVAIEMLQDEFQSTNNPSAKARLAFLLGESFWNMGDAYEAMPWYSESVKFNYGPRAKERQAYALKSLERYSEAADLFQELIGEGTQIETYRKEIAICRLASDWLRNNDPKFEIEAWTYNSRSSDYAPVFLDDHRVIFSSDRSNKTSYGTYNWTGRDFSDIYIYNQIINELSHLDPVINTEHNEGTACFNDDGSVLFFTRCVSTEAYDQYCKLMTSTYIDESWTNPVALPFVLDEVNYGHPFWNEQDSILFYSAELTSGNGGFDLYFVRLDEKGMWLEPKNLGGVINTIGDEKFPSLKGDTLYFASTGHPGMGGLDIFYSYIDNGNWVRPFNMKSPINSGADDFGISFNPNENIKEKGLFTSSRSGIDNIYSFTLKEKDEVEETIEEVVEEGEKVLRLGVTVLAEQEDGTKIPIPKATLTINGKEQKLNAKSFVLLNIIPGEFEMASNYPGYFNTKKIVTTAYTDIPEGKSDYTYNTTIILKRIIADKEILLENIFYDFNKSDIRDDAKPSLIELTSMLNENPEISIELSSHTDCRGPDKYNQKLSQERAQSAVDYIINLGINPSRIRAKGYGEAVPVASCNCDDCSEEEHQLNRRTSFKVTNIGG